MKLMSKVGLVPSVLAVVLVAGCATVPSGVPLGDLSGLPQTTLPGARLEHARSVAMASARSKGWEIVSSSPNQLLLERELPPDAPQAVALGHTPGGRPPQVQVETNMVEGRDGTLVALRSFIITDPGTPDAKKIDYTASYESELLLSLSSLQSAWLATRDKVTSTVPIPTQAEEEMAAVDESKMTPVQVAFAEGAREVAASRRASKTAPSPRRSAPSAAPVQAAAPVEAPAPVRAPAPAQAPAPVALADDRSAVPAASSVAAPASPPSVATSATTSPAPTSAPASTSAPAPMSETTVPSNDMLVLNTSARKGLWAYYAEDYARRRGCAVSDLGAVLLQETADYELHEVHCDGSENVLLKCRGGVCAPMR